MVSPATATAPPRAAGASSGPASSTSSSLSSPAAVVGTTSSSAALPPAAPARRRHQPPGAEKTADHDDDVMRDHERAGLLGRPPPAAAAASSWAAQNQWIVLAVASGACAAFNGVFAKLLTSQISQAITGALGLENYEGAFEVVFRAMFFGLNLAFNGVMWTLFTKALARGSSTTQVSIMNTSANFVITALLGLAIFAENLPPLWWLGAAMLVAGNVIIGRKDDGGGDAADNHSVPDPSDPSPPEASTSHRPGDGGVPQVDTLVSADDEPKDEDVPLIGNVETVV